MKALSALSVVALLAGMCGCGQPFKSSGYTRSATNGVVYSCEITHLGSSAEPIILLSRAGGPGKDYSFTWEVHSKGLLVVDGSPLKPVSQPTAYFKVDGELKSKAISEAGVWYALFRERSPTPEEFALIFDEIERGE